MQLLLDGFMRSKEWQTFALERDQLVEVGRSRARHIVIPLATVGRWHLDLQWDGCRVEFRNRWSANGFWVNDQRVTWDSGVLRLGDTLRVCEAHFQLRVPVRVEPAWFAWNDHTVPRIAQAIYGERAFDRMPILADALEDAGCDNADILGHCRQPGPHVRGCWVVDLLLGKE